MVERSNQRGKSLIIAVTVSTVIFLILHSNELTFQEYGNTILLNLFRIGIFGSLLYFLFKKHNWARYTLAVLCFLLVAGGMVGFLFFYEDWMTVTDTIFISIMFLCMLFNVVILFWSKDVKLYMKT